MSDSVRDWIVTGLSLIGTINVALGRFDRGAAAYSLGRLIALHKVKQ